MSWRTKQEAYKWNSWLHHHGSDANPNCSLCDNHDADEVEHLLVSCTISRRILDNCASILRRLTTKIFPLDDDLIKYNLVDITEEQLEWLIPLKLVNIAKLKLLKWRWTLKASNRTLDNTTDWIETLTTELEDDLLIFIENIKDNYNEEFQQKIHLRRRIQEDV